MGKVRGAALGALLALAWQSSSERDAAGAEPTPFFLSYSAPPSCPEQSEWMSQLLLHSPRAALASEGGSAPLLSVTLTEVPEGVRAELSATDLDGAVTKRALVASTCREAVEGSAWILAVWLDPAAAQGAPPPDGARPAPSSRVVSAQEPPSTPPPVVVAAPPPVAPSDSTATSLRWGVGAEVGTFFTALPDVPIGFGGFLEAAWPRHGVVRPLVALGGFATTSGTSATERGDVRVSLVSGRARGCLLEWPRASFLTLNACVFFELGRLTGRGESTFDPDEAAVTWRALGTSARGRFVLTRLLSLDAEAGLVFPLLRDRFVFGPPPVVAGYTIPAVGGTFSLGLVVHFSGK